MKDKMTTALIAIGLLFLCGGATIPGKEKTITGEGKCAKCALKETDSCQNAIVVEQKGKKVTYYLTDNDVSKEFHDHICKSSAKVKATGVVKEAGDKMELTPTKIELVKE
jgi:hypothetical protein